MFDRSITHLLGREIIREEKSISLSLPLSFPPKQLLFSWDSSILAPSRVLFFFLIKMDTNTICWKIVEIHAVGVNVFDSVQNLSWALKLSRALTCVWI